MEATRPRTRGRTAIDGALALIGIVLVVQMWLVTATLESYLAGHRDSAGPALAFSAVLFAASFGLYRFVVRVDRDARRDLEARAAAARPGPGDASEGPR